MSNTSYYSDELLKAVEDCFEKERKARQKRRKNGLLNIPRCPLCGGKRIIMFSPKRTGLWFTGLWCEKCKMFQPVFGDPVRLFKY